MLKIFYHQKKFLSISKTGKTWHTIIGQQPKAIPPERGERIQNMEKNNQQQNQQQNQQNQQNQQQNKKQNQQQNKKNRENF